MSASKRQLECLFGDSWGFGIDGKFRTGEDYEKNTPGLETGPRPDRPFDLIRYEYVQKDAFAKCDKCKDTGLIEKSYQTKKLKRWRRGLFPCTCKRNS